MKEPSDRIPHALRAGLIVDVYLEMRSHTIELWEILLDPADGDEEMLDRALAAARHTRRPQNCSHDWESHALVFARRRGYPAPLGSRIDHGEPAFAEVCIACPPAAAPEEQAA